MPGLLILIAVSITRKHLIESVDTGLHVIRKYMCHAGQRRSRRHVRELHMAVCQAEPSAVLSPLYVPACRMSVCQVYVVACTAFDVFGIPKSSTLSHNMYKFGICERCGDRVEWKSCQVDAAEIVPLSIMISKNTLHVLLDDHIL